MKKSKLLFIILIAFLVLINIITAAALVFVSIKWIGTSSDLETTKNQLLELQTSKAGNAYLLDLVAKLTNLPLGEEPTVAVVSNANELRGVNDIQDEVYKNVINGDFIIGYTSRVIIYRSSENKIIYEGDSPAALIKKRQTELQQKITQKLAELKVNITAGNVTFSVVTDPLQLNKINFYKNVQIDDIVAVFDTDKIVVVYRPETDSLVAKGHVTTTITPF